MTGMERIRQAIGAAPDPGLMAHVVAGFPDLETTERLILLMAARGAAMIEVQLPFSDPTADGPVIVEANVAALANRTTTRQVLAMLARVRQKSAVPLLIMSYLNPLYAFGLEAFLEEMVVIGLDGLIVPDCPPEEDRLGLPALAAARGIAFVPLIAPGSTEARVREICALTESPFVYTVLRLGVTGRRTELDAEVKAYLDMVARISGRHQAAGFGIRDREQLAALQGHARIGVVGSALIRVLQEAGAAGRDGLAAADAFLSGLAAAPDGRP
jgi:tryptophan synthase alpha chain